MKKGGLPLPTFHLSRVQREEIDYAFKVFDTDSSGFIDRHELRNAFRSLGFDIKKSQIDAFMEQYDPKGYGGIDKVAFHRIIDPLVANRDPLTDIEKSYKGFDQNGKGKPIDLKCLRRLCREFNIIMPDSKLQQMIDEFDEDGDGFINEDDFIKIFAPAPAF